MNSVRSRSQPSVGLNSYMACATRLLRVTEATTLRATELMESLTLSHRLQMGDALIAATAKVKHFGAVEGLDIDRLFKVRGLDEFVPQNNPPSARFPDGQ